MTLAYFLWDCELLQKINAFYDHHDYYYTIPKVLPYVPPGNTSIRITMGQSKSKSAMANRKLTYGQ